MEEKKEIKLFKKVLEKLFFNLISIKFWILTTATILTIKNYLNSDNLTMLFMAYLGANVGQKLIGKFTNGGAE